MALEPSNRQRSHTQICSKHGPHLHVFAMEAAYEYLLQHFPPNRIWAFLWDISSFFKLFLPFFLLCIVTFCFWVRCPWTSISERVGYQQWQVLFILELVQWRHAHLTCYAPRTSWHHEEAKQHFWKLRPPDTMKGIILTRLTTPSL